MFLQMVWLEKEVIELLILTLCSRFDFFKKIHFYP